VYSTHIIEFTDLLHITKLHLVSVIKNNKDYEWDPIILSVIKSRIMRWARQVAPLGEVEAGFRLNE
jgi:hypothetical protein